MFTETDVNNEQEEDVSKNGIDAINQMAISETDWTTETIVRQIERGNIILDPDFQRREAWTLIKRQDSPFLAATLFTEKIEEQNKTEVKDAVYSLPQMHNLPESTKMVGYQQHRV